MSTAPLAHAAQIKVPATYMRGGTSKGVFFALEDLPEKAQQPGPLLRLSRANYVQVFAW